MTMLTPLHVLAADEMEAVEEWEAVLRDLAGFRSDVVPIGSAAENDDVAGCISDYNKCMRRAKERYNSACRYATARLGGCVGAASAAKSVALITCAATAVLALKCVAVTFAVYAVAVIACSADYWLNMSEAEENYERDQRYCREDADDDGCLDLIPIRE